MSASEEIEGTSGLADSERPQLTPDLTIVQERGVPRPQLLLLRARDQAARRPRLARVLAVQHAPRLHRHAAHDRCPASGTTRAPADAPAGSSSGCWRAPGPATSRSTSRSSCSASRARRSTAARPGRREHPGATTSSSGTGEEQVGLEAGRLAVRLVNHLVDSATRISISRRSSTSLIRLAERGAFGPSTQAILDEADQPRHPVHPAQRESLVQLGQGGTSSGSAPP